MIAIQRFDAFIEEKIKHYRDLIKESLDSGDKENVFIYNKLVIELEELLKIFKQLNISDLVSLDGQPTPNLVISALSLQG